MSARPEARALRTGGILGTGAVATADHIVATANDRNNIIILTTVYRRCG